jgi:hypothetical protein
MTKFYNKGCLCMFHILFILPINAASCISGNYILGGMHWESHKYKSLYGPSWVWACSKLDAKILKADKQKSEDDSPSMCVTDVSFGISFLNSTNCMLHFIFIARNWIFSWTFRILSDIDVVKPLIFSTIDHMLLTGKYSSHLSLLHLMEEFTSIFTHCHCLRMVHTQQCSW